MDSEGVVTGFTGGEPLLGDGVSKIVRLTPRGGFGVGQVQPRHYEMAKRGNLYFAANQAAIASPAGLATASLNLTLYNPAGSGVDLVLLEILAQASAAPAAGSMVWLVGNLTATQAAPATATALAIRNAYLGGAAGKGLVYSTATLAAAPVVLFPLASVLAVSANPFWFLRYNVDGQVIVPPGIYISIQASTVVSLQCGMLWEEQKVA